MRYIFLICFFTLCGSDQNNNFIQDTPHYIADTSKNFLPPLKEFNKEEMEKFLILIQNTFNSLYELIGRETMWIDYLNNERKIHLARLATLEQNIQQLYHDNEELRQQVNALTALANMYTRQSYYPKQ